MSSEGPYGRQGFQSNPAGYGAGSDYTQQPIYGYGGGAAYGAPPPPPSSDGYDYNPYGGESSYEVRKQRLFLRIRCRRHALYHGAVMRANV